MHPNEALIHQFYTSFGARDAAGMTACYAPNVAFSDPVFGELRGPRANAMWEMLCQRGADLTITFSNVQADNRAGRAHWGARYTWSATRRPVHNIIAAAFQFENGLITRHADTFNLYRWTRMALGLTGTLLGWTPIVQGKVRQSAAAGLERYLAGRTGSMDT